MPGKWPKTKTASVCVYFEVKDKTYCIVDKKQLTSSGMYEGLAAVYVPGALEKPAINFCGIQPSYIANRCRRVEWSSLPPKWKTAFRCRLDKAPEQYLGFWRIP